MDEELIKTFHRFRVADGSGQFFEPLPFIGLEALRRCREHIAQLGPDAKPAPYIQGMDDLGGWYPIHPRTRRTRLLDTEG